MSFKILLLAPGVEPSWSKIPTCGTGRCGQSICRRQGRCRRHRARWLHGNGRSGEALRTGHLAGAGLDVADPEPLHPIPGAGACRTSCSPYVAIYGTPYREQREATLIGNYRCFAVGQPLLNLVDKVKWF
jgi:hypothetical protein